MAGSGEGQPGGPRQDQAATLCLPGCARPAVHSERSAAPSILGCPEGSGALSASPVSLRGLGRHPPGLLGLSVPSGQEAVDW